MKTSEKEAIRSIRETLSLTRLDPRRLYLVDDGAYQWIGDRAELTAATARQLRAIHEVGSHPDRVDPQTRCIADEADYDAICSDTLTIAATCGGGIVAWTSLPDDWRSGYALGDISPLG